MKLLEKHIGEAILNYELGAVIFTFAGNRIPWSTEEIIRQAGKDHLLNRKNDLFSLDEINLSALSFLMFGEFQAMIYKECLERTLYFIINNNEDLEFQSCMGINPVNIYTLSICYFCSAIYSLYQKGIVSIEDLILELLRVDIGLKREIEIVNKFFTQPEEVLKMLDNSNCKKDIDTGTSKRNIEKNSDKEQETDGFWENFRKALFD